MGERLPAPYEITASRAEPIPRIDQTLLAAIANATPAGLYVINDQGFFVYVNPASEALSGYSREELLGMSFLGVMHPDFHHEARQIWQARLRGDAVPVRRETKMLTKSGEVRWVDFTVTPMSAGGERCWLGTVIDITDRKMAQARLSESEARIRNIFDQASDGIFLLSAENRYLDANGHGVEMLGYTKEELLHMTVADVLAPNERPRLAVEPQEMMAGKPHLAEWEHLRKDGSTFHAEVRARRLNDQTYFAIVHDLTARKQAEAQLRAHELQLRLFVEHSPAAIAMFDREMRYLVVSRRWLADYDISQKNIIGMSHYEVFPDLPERWKQIHQRCLSGEVETCEEDPFPRADGSTDWVQWEVHPWRTVEGHIGGIIIFSELITVRKRTEQELRALTGQLLRAQEEERQRLARELHDGLAQGAAAVAVNLSRVMKSAAMLDEPAAKALANAQELIATCSREIRTTAHLLYPPLLDELGLVAAIRSYAQGFAERSNISVDLALPGKMERLPRDAEVALFRVVQESLGNIQRHSGSASCRIRVQQQGGKTNLEVSDSGCGVPPEVLAPQPGELGKVGVGIRGMRERLRQLGGSLEIISGSEGTTVLASLPASPGGA